jgi:hypothetical protein
VVSIMKRLLAIPIAMLALPVWSAGPDETTRAEIAHLLKKSLVTTTESFIERAATESSMSGKPYSVKCADAPAVASATWLRAELSNFRAKRVN